MLYCIETVLSYFPMSFTRGIYAMITAEGPIHRYEEFETDEDETYYEETDHV